MRIVIEGDGARATDVGKILAATDKAFQQFNRARPPHRRAVLTVEAVTPGSVDIGLGILQVYKTFSDTAAILAPFAEHLGQIFDWLRFGVGLPPRPVDRAVAKSIIEPVARGRAQQINIVNNGEIYVSVGADEARSLLNALARSGATEADPEPPRPQRTAALLTAEDSQSLQGAGLEGTALLVEGSWYARLLHGLGVLVPARGETSGLQHNRPYRFHGYPATGRFGEIVGIHLSGAEPIA
jgi:hypothetical protein